MERNEVLENARADFYRLLTLFPDPVAGAQHLRQALLEGRMDGEILYDPETCTGCLIGHLSAQARQAGTYQWGRHDLNSLRERITGANYRHCSFEALITFVKPGQTPQTSRPLAYLLECLEAWLLAQTVPAPVEAHEEVLSVETNTFAERVKADLFTYCDTFQVEDVRSLRQAAIEGRLTGALFYSLQSHAGCVIGHLNQRALLERYPPLEDEWGAIYFSNAIREAASRAHQIVPNPDEAHFATFERYLCGVYPDDLPGDNAKVAQMVAWLDEYLVKRHVRERAAAPSLWHAVEGGQIGGHQVRGVAREDDARVFQAAGHQARADLLPV